MTDRLWHWLEKRLTDGPVHATLLDPGKDAPDEAAKLAARMKAAGTDMIWVGGSTDVDVPRADAMVRAVRAATGLPVLLFPSGHHMVCPSVDAVLFTSLFNSRDPRFIVREQALGAELILGSGVEAWPTAYLVVEPGMTVGRVGKADLLARDNAGFQLARGYAMAARVLGLRLVYLEAGSGADAPPPPGMVKEVRRAGLPVIVGGGIRNEKDARELVAAGASIVVTGTVVEQDVNAAAAVVAAVRGGP